MPRRNVNARGGHGKWYTTKQKGRNRGRGGAMKATRKASSHVHKTSTRRAA